MSNFIDVTTLGVDIPLVRQTQVNTASTNKFSLSISNIPRLGNIGEVDIQLLTGFYKSTILPGMSLQTIPSTFMRHTRHHPADKGNQDMNKLSITFNVSENYENYMFFRKWLWDLRNGLRPEDGMHLVDYIVNDIILTLYDNQKRVIMKMTTKMCLLEDVSDLDLNSDSSSDLTFTTSWIYHDFDVEYFSIYKD